MNKQQQNVNSMLNSVLLNLNNNEAKLGAMPIALTLKQQYDKLMESVKEYIVASNSNSGIRMEKDGLKEELADQAELLSGALQLYATISEDVKMMEDVKLTRTTVNKTVDAKVKTVLNPLITNAQKHMDVLADYGVTKAQLKELVTDLNSFNELVGQPRSKQIDVNVNKKLLDEALDKAHDFLKLKMDKAMLYFKKHDPEFFDSYTRARVIVDR